jgi:hypothetical protein
MGTGGGGGIGDVTKGLALMIGERVGMVA